MRTLDDFAFVKEAGFDELYGTIQEAWSLYNEDKLRFFCGECRRPLEQTLIDIYKLIDYTDVPDNAGQKIGRLSKVLPEELFSEATHQLFDSLNHITRDYNHKEKNPPREEWNKHAESCGKLIWDICQWLVSFKAAYSLYIEKNGQQDFEAIFMAKKKAASDMPSFQSVSHPILPPIEALVSKRLDEKNRYTESLKSNLTYIYNTIYNLSVKCVEEPLKEIEKEGYEIIKYRLSSDEKEKFSLALSASKSLLPRFSATNTVLLYSGIIHPILFSNNWSPESLANQPYSGGTLTANDIFSGLKSINEYAAKIILSKLDCPLNIIETLQYDLEKGNEEHFVSLLKKQNCNLTCLHNAANIMPTLMMMCYGLKVDPKGAFEWLNHIGLPFEEVSAPNNPLSFFDEKHDITTKEELEAFLLDTLRKIVENTEYVISQIPVYYNQVVNSPDWNLFFPFEQKYLIDLMEDPIFKSYNEKLRQGAICDNTNSPTIEPSSNNKESTFTFSDDFELPEDFFSSKYPRDAKNTDKHFNLEYDIEKCGGTKFSLLVNTIASWGFISSSAKEKQLLAYILSGRSMPSGYQGKGLEWIDNGYGYELLYVIKYIIGNEKGKYEKARKLFHGPQWLGKGDFKDQADYADAAFRRALNAIYPEVCIIKGHVETVREPIRESGGFHIPDNPIKP